MLELTWTFGILRRQRTRVAGAAVGVAIAVGLLTSLAGFVSNAKQGMTEHAVRGVPVDWQVEVQPDADAIEVQRVVGRAAHVLRSATVGFSPTTGLEATTASTTQTTGPGIVIGLPDSYRRTFPGELRTLGGRGTGVLLAQQAAANLNVRPGDRISIGRAGAAALVVVVDGIVDVPQANSLFQTVGAPAGAQPTAPPDNVVFLPWTAWEETFGSTAGTAGARLQIHARLDRAWLGHDPTSAFSTSSGAARHLEVVLAGRGLVGDNLGAALDAARADALYAQVLFLLLALPGAVLAGLLTGAMGGAARERRRRDFALVRLRGGSPALLGRMALAEAVVVAALGGIGGVALGLIIARLGLGAGGADVASSWMWITAALLAGVGIVIAAIWLPSRHDARHATVSAARADVGRRSRPLPMRLGLDLIALVVGALIVWASSRGGYAVVLAPEGVPSVSVNYAALVGPLLLWVGLGLGGWRFADALTRRRDLLRRLVRPAGRGLSPVIASNLSRRHGQLARAIALLALSVAFAASTSVFNATYRQQVEVDAALTNGADVTVTELPGSKVAADERSRLAGVPGVSRVDALQHRFAYVGSDLQDLYGVEPGTIADAVHLQDAYVAGGTVRSLMRELERRPDGVLVSAETVHDFQLRPGDQLRLRLPDARTGALREIDFHYVGIVKEFPTAPSDSFLVANAAYIAERTGDASVGTWLLDTDAAPPVAVARRVRAAVGAGATVTDIETSRRIVGSSLTAVDLRGLTRVELGFALALAAGSAGLVLTLGLAERRRTFALIRALGGRRDQLAAFIRAEALATTAAGLLLGIVGGWALATVLVKVLTGVFDPPPSHLAVPWAYLAVTLSCVVGSVVATTEIVHRAVARPAVEQLRDL